MVGFAKFVQHLHLQEIPWQKTPGNSCTKATFPDSIKIGCVFAKLPP
jgi:hypothetical protein